MTTLLNSLTPWIEDTLVEAILFGQHLCRTERYEWTETSPSDADYHDSDARLAQVLHAVMVVESETTTVTTATSRRQFSTATWLCILSDTRTQVYLRLPLPSSAPDLVEGCLVRVSRLSVSTFMNAADMPPHYYTHPHPVLAIDAGRATVLTEDSPGLVGDPIDAMQAVRVKRALLTLAMRKHRFDTQVDNISLEELLRDYTPVPQGNLQQYVPAPGRSMAPWQRLWDAALAHAAAQERSKPATSQPPAPIRGKQLPRLQGTHGDPHAKDAKPMSLDGNEKEQEKDDDLEDHPGDELGISKMLLDTSPELIRNHRGPKLLERHAVARKRPAPTEPMTHTKVSSTMEIGVDKEDEGDSQNGSTGMPNKSETPRVVPVQPKGTALDEDNDKNEAAIDHMDDEATPPPPMHPLPSVPHQRTIDRWLTLIGTGNRSPVRQGIKPRSLTLLQDQSKS